MRRTIVFPALILLLLGLQAPAANANNGVSVTHFSASGQAYNSCTNELMDVTTEGTFFFRIFADSAGGFHLVYSLTQMGSAVGEQTGFSYRFNATQAEVENDIADLSATDFTLVGSLLVIGRGGAPNLRMHTTFHMTIIDGVLTSYVSNITYDCA